MPEPADSVTGASAAGESPAEEILAGEHPEGDQSGATTRAAALSGGIAKAVRAGASGETLTAAGVLDAVGGVRGVIEAIVPSLLFVLIFVPTQDARISALVPGVLALLLVVVRLVRRETFISALSGMLGVGIAVTITFITGRGVDYFVSGFFVNIAWGIGLLVSIVIGWPAVGLLFGLLDGDFRSWRRVPKLRRAAVLLTAMWLALFVLRLAVQLPMYMAGRTAELGVARIVMGIPLFAVIIVVTWFAIRRVRPSSDDSGRENGVISGENTPSQ